MPTASTTTFNAYPVRSIRDERYALIWNLTPEKEYHEKHLMKDPPSNTGVWEAWKSSENTDPEAKRLIDRFVHRPEFEFYDVENDPWEMNNLADKPEYRNRIKKMKKELEKWMEQQGDKGAAMDVSFPGQPK